MVISSATQKVTIKCSSMFLAVFNQPFFLKGTCSPWGWLFPLSLSTVCQCRVMVAPDSDLLLPGTVQILSFPLWMNLTPLVTPPATAHIAPSSHKSHICFAPCGTDYHCSAATVNIHHKSAYFQIPSELPYKGKAIAQSIDSGTKQARRKEEEKAHTWSYRGATLRAWQW